MNRFSLNKCYLALVSSLALNIPTALSNGFTQLSDYSDINAPFALQDISSNASGITWNEKLAQFLVVRNNAATIYRYSKDWKYLGKITKSGNMNNDTEGLTTINGIDLVVVTEEGFAHRFEIDEDTAKLRTNYNSAQAYQLVESPKVRNKGLEAVAFRAGNKKRPARIYAGQEGSGREKDALMKVVYFDIPETDLSVNKPKSFVDGSLDVIEPFDAEEKLSPYIRDIAGMTFDPSGNHLLIISQESSKIIQVNPETGKVLGELKLTDAPAYEGITIGPEGEIIAVSERNWIQIINKSK